MAKKSREIEKVADAFLSIAMSQKNTLLLERELKQIAGELASNMELKRYLGSQQIEAGDKVKVMLSALGEHASKSARAAVCIIIALDLYDYVKDIYDSYVSKADQLKKQVAVEVVSAVKLDKKSLGKIKESVDRKTGLDVRIRNTVDSSIIAGLVIRVGDLNIDLSMRGKLESLREDLKSIELEGEIFGT